MQLFLSTIIFILSSAASFAELVCSRAAKATHPGLNRCIRIDVSCGENDKTFDFN